MTVFNLGPCRHTHTSLKVSRLSRQFDHYITVWSAPKISTLYGLIGCRTVGSWSDVTPQFHNPRKMPLRMPDYFNSLPHSRQFWCNAALSSDLVLSLAVAYKCASSAVATKWAYQSVSAFCVCALVYFNAMVDITQHTEELNFIFCNPQDCRLPCFWWCTHICIQAPCLCSQDCKYTSYMIAKPTCDILL